MADELQTPDQPILAQPPSKGDKLYQNLTNLGFGEQQLGKKEEFTKALQNPINANKIYSGLRVAGLGEEQLGSLKEFQTSFAPTSPTPTMPHPLNIDKQATNRKQYIQDLQVNPNAEHYQQLAQQRADYEKENPGSWSNTMPILTHAITRMVTKPLAGVTRMTRDLIGATDNKTAAAKPLYGANGELTDYGKQVDNGKQSDVLGKLVTGLDAYNNQTEKEDYHTPLPHNLAGNTATGIIGIAPDIISTFALPEERVGAGLLEKMAFNPFNKVLATKGGLNAYSEAEQKGVTPATATVEGLKGAGKAELEATGMNILSGVGHALSPKIVSMAEDAGLVKDNILTQKGSAAMTNAALFGAYPVAKNLIQGKPFDKNELESGIGMGIVFGLTGGSPKKAEETRQAIAVQNFMNASPEAIKSAHDIETPAADINADAIAHAAKFDETKDPQYAATASTLTKTADVKATTDAILKNKDGFISSIEQSHLPDETKQAVIAKVEDTHKVLDPTERAKNALGNQISDIDTQLSAIPKEETDPVKSAENEVKTETLTKQREDLNNQLKQTILKQQENESTNQKNGEESSSQSGSEKSSTESNGVAAEKEVGKSGEEESTPVAKQETASHGGEKADINTKISKIPFPEIKTLTVPDGKLSMSVIDQGLKQLREEKNLSNDVLQDIDKLQKYRDSVNSILNGTDKANPHSKEFKDFSNSLGATKSIGDALVSKEGEGAYIELSPSNGNPKKAGLSIEVPEKERGKGVGRAKLNDVTAKADEHGIELNLSIDKAQPEANRLQKLYESVGFRVSEKQADSELLRMDRLPSTEKDPAKTSDKAKILADRIRSLKSDRNKLHGGLDGVATAVYDGALETVATAIEAGGKLADAIQAGIEHIKAKYPELDEKDVRNHFETELNGIEEIEPTIKEKPREVKKTVLTKRAYEGDISEDVKKHLEEKGLTRKSYSQNERSKQADIFIKEFGEEDAIKAVKSGDVDGALAASILAKSQIKTQQEMAELPVGSDERDALAKKQASYIELTEKKAYSGGEFNGQLGHEYQNAELNYANVKAQVERLSGKSINPEQEKRINKLIAENEALKKQIGETESKLIDETDKVIGEGKEAKVETNAQKGKRIADNLRKNAKIHRPGVFNSATPATIAWDAAIEITAQSIEAGGKLADAINKGLEHIKSTDWHKNLPDSKKILSEKEFSQFNKDNSGSIDLADLQERFLNKKGNKFSPPEAKDIWGYMKKNYLDSGVSYRDAIANTANDLGLSWRQTSEAIAAPKTKKTADEMWKKQSEATRHRSAIQNWVNDQNSSPTWKAYKKLTGIFRGVAVFGHGHIFVGTHAGMTLFNPLTAAKSIKAFANGWKFAYGNEGVYQRAMDELTNDPNYLLAQRAGLKSNPERINVEEYQNSQKYLGRIGLTGERGFNAIKVLRQDLFNFHYNRLSPTEQADPTVAPVIAHIVNLATGATNAKIPSWVNEVTFAGGMEAARLEKITKSPIKATDIALRSIFKPKDISVADKVFAKVWAKRVGWQIATYGSLLAVNAAIQNQVNPNNPVNVSDPTKPDWLDFKFGDYSVGPTSGMTSAAKFIYTLANAPFTDKEDRKGKKILPYVGNKILRYARGKLSPFYGTVADVYTGEDFNGNTLPYNDETPSKYAHQLSWTEYGSSKLMLPAAEAFKVAYDSAIENGSDSPGLDDIMKGIIGGGLSGSTGFRVMDYKPDQ